MGATFDQYEKRGAYHWAFLSNNPWHHHCPTVARYQAVLKAGHLYWPGAKVVDVGCGDGALAGRMAKAGAQVTGVEPEIVGRKLAKQKFEQHALAGTFVAQLTELENDSFDVAVCCDVIEHVEQPEQLLLDIRRILKPRGIAIITTPIRLTETPLDANHVQEFFPSQFQTLMESCFTEIQVQRHIPLAGLMLYYWCPWFFLRRPLITLSCNLLNICFGINPVEKINALDRYHLLQLAIARKPE